MFINYKTAIASAALVGLVILLMHMFARADGFRSKEEKQETAASMLAMGVPTYKGLKMLGLDGAEYYDARQLWNRNKYTRRNIESML